MKFVKILSAVIITLAVIAYFTSDYFIEKQLKHQLSNLINRDSLKLYTYEFKNLDLSLVNGSVKISGVKLHPSKYALENIQSDSGNIRVLVDISFNQIKLKGFEINHFLKTQEMIIEKLIIVEPKFTYLYNPKKEKNTSTLSINQIFSSSFKKASLRKFLIENAELKIKNMATKEDNIYIKRLDIELTEAYMDSLTIKRFSPFNYNDINFTADNLTLNISSDFSLTTEEISFDSKINTTSINGFKLQPKYSQGEFSKKYNVQKQWVAITLKKLQIKNINFEKLVQHGDFEIGKLIIENANVGLYKDKSAPEPLPQLKLLPASALAQLPIDISIDTIEIKNSRIVINEKSKTSGSVSELSFEKLNAIVKGFSNDSLKLLKNSFLTVSAETKIMNSAPVKFNAKFDLLSKKDTHYINAAVGATSANVFNKVLEPMMLVVIKSGKIKALNYQYIADNESAMGTIDFEYENIKIDVYDKNNKDKKQGFLSLAANTVLKSNNKKENKKTYVQGVIKIDRVKHKDIFPYLWHTVQTGIIYTIAPALSEIKKEEKKANKKGWFKKK